MIDLALATRDLAREIDNTRLIEATYYLENTWTPTYDGVVPGTTTYTTQSGDYTRLGRVVIARARLVWTNATGTGVIRLGGLPFAAAVTVSFAVTTFSVTFANGSVQGLLQAGNTLAQLFSPATNAGSTELTVEAAGQLDYCIVYFI